MPRRTSEELRADIDTADDLLRIFHDYRKIHFSHDPAEADGALALPDKETWIADLRESGASWSAILKGYQQALNDTLAVFALTDPDAEAFGQGLRAYYRDRTGKDLFSIVTPPMRRLKAIAKRGRIRDESEFHLARDFVAHRSDDPKTADLAQTLSDCLGVFEADKST